jgi:hypothetical protein
MWLLVDRARYRAMELMVAFGFYMHVGGFMASRSTTRTKVGRSLRKPKRAAAKQRGGRTFDARPDTLDFRDQMFVPTLVEVPTTITLASYRESEVPILNQGSQGACTGFGLATVANFLLRRRKVVPDSSCVSPQMFYEMARRYDEWPGENYSGSSARGAMKGWHKHGVCTEPGWPCDAKKTDPKHFARRWSEASLRPLGAYFRVNHKDLVAMHCAISEVGVLYATSTVHSGWDSVDKTGHIEFVHDDLGGHAFAIVAFDEIGFWIQNSWGSNWGFHGFGRVTYADWFANGTDVWVGRLGAPVIMSDPQATASGITGAAKGSRAYVFADLRPHIISIGNDGQLRSDGMYGTSRADVEEIITVELPRITENWATRRILLYAHGGLVPEDSAVQHIAEYRASLLEAEIYPLAFVWKTDYWTTVTDMLQDALHRRRPEGILDATKDFMLDRLDDALEPLARQLTGKAAWDEMKKNALAATLSQTGGARVAIQYLAQLAKKYRNVEFHLVAHSAGAIFHAPLVQLLTGSVSAAGSAQDSQGFGCDIESCTLWAPACTIQLFTESYITAREEERIKALTVFTLVDEVERADNCAKIYHKSLLYLVSNAFEDTARIPPSPDGVAIAGMAKFLDNDPRVNGLISAGKLDRIASPNSQPLGSKSAARAQAHGGFDDDKATLEATLLRIAKLDDVPVEVTTRHSATGQRAVRQELIRAQ